MIKIVKVGGGIIEDDAALAAFLKSFAQIEGPKVLVHGGGRLATKMADDLGYETKMVDGRRVTDENMLQVVTMVYGGLANKKIVAALQAVGVNAIGLTGADGNLVKAHKRPIKTVDYGFVGDVDDVNGDLLNTLVKSGLVPVVAPLSHDGYGTMLNTNADTIASAVAVALAKITSAQLIFGFELNGVLRDFSDKSSVIEKITPDLYQKFKGEGIISDGMIPKLDNAFSAINSGVSSVKICNALKVGEAGGTTILGD